jgi:chromosome partitioning protein
VGNVIALLNQKGGVGKTTVTLGLASAAAQSGARVLVVDIDPQASSTWILGLDPLTVAPNTADLLASKHAKADPVPSAWTPLIEVLPASAALLNHEDGKKARLRNALKPLREHYDVVLVDCPPSLGNLTANGLTAADHALIVVEPAALALRGIGAVADLIDDIWDGHNRDLDLAGVVVNRAPAVSNEAERRLDELERIVGKKAVWSPPIRQRVILNQASAERRPIHSYGSRAGDVIDAFDQLWFRIRRIDRK